MAGRKIITYDGRTGIIIEEHNRDSFRVFDVDIAGEEFTFFASEIQVYNHG